MSDQPRLDRPVQKPDFDAESPAARRVARRAVSRRKVAQGASLAPIVMTAMSTSAPANTICSVNCSLTGSHATTTTTTTTTTAP
jgi:hypothetical protein